MRLPLMLAALTASGTALAEPSATPSRLALLCQHSGTQSSGLNKTCYYACAGVEGGGTTRNLYEACPRWMARWRLNKNSQFGPSAASR